MYCGHLDYIFCLTFKIPTMLCLTNIMWNSDTHAWLSGRQMLLGGTDAWFQLVATRLKFWLINRVFHCQGQGDREWVGEGVKALHATVTCAVHKKQRGLCEEIALPQLESTGLCPAWSSLSLLAGSPTFISCTIWCHMSLGLVGMVEGPR